MIVSSTVGWPDVAMALIVAVPSILGAFFAGLVALRTKTSNGRSIGQLADDTSRQLKTGNEKTVGAMVTEAHGELSRQQTPYDTHLPPPA